MQFVQDGQTVKIHPIRSEVWKLSPSDEKSRTGGHISLILFDKRQVWKAYYYHFMDLDGWQVERGCMILRMPVKDFEMIFGKYEIRKTTGQ